MEDIQGPRRLKTADVLKGVLILGVIRAHVHAEQGGRYREVYLSVPPAVVCGAHRFLRDILLCLDAHSPHPSSIRHDRDMRKVLPCISRDPHIPGEGGTRIVLHSADRYRVPAVVDGSDTGVGCLRCRNHCHRMHADRQEEDRPKRLLMDDNDNSTSDRASNKGDRRFAFLSLPRMK